MVDMPSFQSIIRSNVQSNAKMTSIFVCSAELGSSSDPCSITYHGASPASDPETRIIQSTIEELRGKLVLFLTYNTIGELYMFPFGLRDDN